MERRERRRAMDTRYRIDQLKLPYGLADSPDVEKLLLSAAARKLGIPEKEIRGLTIARRSIDARKKPDIYAVFSVDLLVQAQGRRLERLKKAGLRAAPPESYPAPPHGELPLRQRPVIIGSGPAGLFCALLLAREGYCPLILERGEAVEERRRRVEAFWEGRAPLHPDSNVQFGEGGAGTFSDGKLNTLVKDPSGRGREVLRCFVEYGAPPDILWQHRPHLGTDLLCGILQNMRRSLCSLGAEFRFSSKVTGLSVKDGRLAGLILNGQEYVPAEAAVLAPGHSARDTFAMLEELGISMEAKAFAVGMRLEHPQELIQHAQYGSAGGQMPPADYKVTYTASNGRGVYSFCMCPGGYVVDASSEEGRLAVNGMSYHSRSSGNANSAMIVTVTPADFPQKGPLAGIAFQRELEARAYVRGRGKIPQQLFGDFCDNRPSAGYGSFPSCARGGTAFANLRGLLPAAAEEALIEGIRGCGRKIMGFDRSDAILSAVESRTSSPVRILRDAQGQSSLPGLYPCGEGAGYAGGITSAAMDGLRTAEQIIRAYAPLSKN